MEKQQRQLTHMGRVCERQRVRQNTNVHVARIVRRTFSVLLLVGPEAWRSQEHIMLHDYNK